MRMANSLSAVPNSTFKVETTLSLAMNPVIKAVDIRQSPKPRGFKAGAMTPAAAASMLSWESATMFRWKSKVCRNQMTMVATKMTVKALWRKSFALSQSSRPTFFAPGSR